MGGVGIGIVNTPGHSGNPKMSKQTAQNPKWFKDLRKSEH